MPNRAQFRSRLPTLSSEVWVRNQYAVLTSVVFGWMGAGFVTPVLPLFFQQLGVGNPAEAAVLSGIAFGAPSLTIGITAPIWGGLADRFGIKPIIQWGLFGFATSTLIMSLVVTPAEFVGARIITGLFSVFGSLAPVIATLGVPSKEIGPVVGRLQAIQVLGTALGPVLGGIIADQLGIRANFLIAAAFVYFSMIVISVLYRQPERPKTVAAQARKLGRWALLTRSSFGSLTLMLVLVYFVDRGFQPILPLFLASLDPTIPIASTAGVVLSAGLLASALSASQAGAWLSRRSARFLLVASLLVGLLGWAPLIVVQSVWQVFLLRIIQGLATGALATLTYTLTARLVPPEIRATAFALLTSGSSLSGAAGPTSAGVLAGISIRLTFVVFTVVYAAALGVAFLASGGKRLEARPAETEIPAA